MGAFLHQHHTGQQSCVMPNLYSYTSSNHAVWGLIQVHWPFKSNKNTKIKIAPSVDKGRILIRILVTCLHLQRTKNDKRERLWVCSCDPGYILKEWVRKWLSSPIYTRMPSHSSYLGRWRPLSVNSDFRLVQKRALYSHIILIWAKFPSTWLFTHCVSMVQVSDYWP